MIRVCEEELCTGCGACIDVCAHSAINWIEDKEGFHRPVIDQSKCVDCGMCVRTCPSNRDYVTEEFDKKVYAGYSKTWQKKGSSGGIFSALAEPILREGGIVYGAAYDDDFELSQTRITSIEELPKLQGSKYSQSESRKSFFDAKSDLRDGKKVLYCGTPCQVAGLQNFIPKRLKGNLITVDFVCHGVPSQKAFDKVIESIERQYNTKPDDFGYRLTECQSTSPFVKFSSRKLILKGDVDIYMKAFYKYLLFRPSCYQCQFSSLRRPGDITIADFWKLTGFKKTMEKFNGVSMIIVNTEKGSKVFESIKDGLYIESRPLEYAVVRQHNLQRPSERPQERTTSALDFVNMSIFDFGKKYGLLPKNKLVNSLKFHVKLLTMKLRIFKYLNKK